ncbi:uncharacterized protein G2W53_027627 [Senna tora]|uniref:Retrotransposon Copia-like N-terminal domain-containing protein n=1 Tax=Senna tora TaxID=362788 RepID=A0A834WGS6_9FABA|nr:uncharacterized protein G2W53_027627 [Senna tora]
MRRLMADESSNSSSNKTEGAKGSAGSGVVAEVNYRRDPYYLHPSVSSGLQLVPNKLTQDNYMLWRRAMMIALKTKNKLGFVDGEAYENVVDNILLMELIPSFNKVYAMLIRVEKQRKISNSNFVEAFALLVKAGGTVDQKSLVVAVARSSNLKVYDKKKEKASKFCTACSRNRHTNETYFKKDIQIGQKQNASCDDRKLMKGKPSTTSGDSPVNASYFVNFTGKVRLAKGLVLDKVIYVPEFKYNLISVSKLVARSDLQVTFHKYDCVVQDLLTKKQVEKED